MDLLYGNFFVPGAKNIEKRLDRKYTLHYNIVMDRTKDLKALRRSRNLMLADLADRLGVTPGYLSHIETGFRKLNEGLLKRMAKALKIPEKTVRHAAKQTEDGSILEKSWISQIRAKGYPLLKAFRYELSTVDPPIDFKNKNTVRDRLVQFVVDNIRYSLYSELTEDEKLLDRVIEVCRD